MNFPYGKFFYVLRSLHIGSVLSLIFCKHTKVMPEHLFSQLQGYLRELAAEKPLALAYSGGLDSRFLAHAAQQARCDMVLYHATGPHVPQEESDFALSWAKQHGMAVHVFALDVCQLELVRNNNKKRCYYCKKHLLTLFTKKAVSQGRRVCDGTNADDMQAYRPGLQALQEESILSPLATCGLHKKDIRALAKSTGLSWPEQKARPCLLTRFAYNMPINATMLTRVAKAEHALACAGLEDFRLRLTPTPVLQTIAHTVDEAVLHALLAKHGFTSAQIRVEASISGFFDKT